MVLRLVLAALCFGAAAFMLKQLSDWGMDILAVEQWSNLILNIMDDPANFTGLLLSTVILSAAFPIVGILCLVLAVQVRGAAEVKSIRVDTRKLGRGVKSEASRRVEEPVDEVEFETGISAEDQPAGRARWSRFSAALLVVLGGVWWMIRRFVLLVLRLLKNARAKEKVARLARRVTAAVARRFGRDVAGGDTTMPTKDSIVRMGADSDRDVEICNEVIVWYGVWGSAGPRQRPPRMFDQAARLHAEMNHRRRQMMTESYSMRGLSALSALDAAAALFDGNAVPSKEVLEVAEPIDPPSLAELVENGGEADLVVGKEDADDRPTGDDDDADGLEGDDPFSIIGGIERQRSDAASATIGHVARVAEPVAEGDDGDDGEDPEDGGLLDIIDDIGGPSPSASSGPVQAAVDVIPVVDRRVDQGTGRESGVDVDNLLQSLINDQPALTSGDSERDPNGKGSEAEERDVANAILVPTPRKLVDPTLEEDVDVGFDEVRADLVSALDDLVGYQARIMGWSHFGEKLGDEFDSIEKRRSYLVERAGVVTKIKASMSPNDLLGVMVELGESEHAAWLDARASRVFEAIEQGEDDPAVRHLLAAEEVAGEKELQGSGSTYADLSYEETWRRAAPAADAYKELAKASGVELYRSIQVVSRRSDGGQEFGLVDAIIGDLRIRVREKLAAMVAGVVGVIFVALPSGDWTLDPTADDDEFEDRLVFRGVGGSGRKAVRVKDRNLRILADWASSKGLRTQGVIHLVIEEDTTISGIKDPAAAVQAMQARIDDIGLPYIVRLDTWSEFEWQEAKDRYVLPRR